MGTKLKTTTTNNAAARGTCVHLSRARLALQLLGTRLFVSTHVGLTRLTIHAGHPQCNALLAGSAFQPIQTQCV